MFCFHPKGLIFFLVAGLSGCATLPVPLTIEERENRIVADQEAIFATPPLPPGPVTLETAMARAIRYHLATRVKAMDIALAQGLTNVASYHQLPSLALTSKHEERNRLTTESQNLFESSNSLSVAWNILDFGVSYLHTRQQTDRVLIAQELRRKAAHHLIQDVQTTFWRAWAAQHLQSQMDPLLNRVRMALNNAREAERQRLQPPMQLLDYQRMLLKTWQQIQESWKGLSGAKVALAELMNINPGDTFELTAPKESPLPDLEQFPSLERLERLALQQRPELREKDYQVRIQSLETYKEMLRMLPGVEFKSSREYNSGDAYINHVWAESGVKLVWNLLKLITTPSQIAVSRSQEEHQEWMRRSLSISVLAQVHVGYRRLLQAKEEFDTARALSDVNERAYKHAQAGQQATSMNELDLIHREAERITTTTRRDVAYAELRNAIGAFFVTLGSDVLVDPQEEQDTQTLEQTIAAQLTAWDRGEFQGVTKDGVVKKPHGSIPADVATPEWVIETKPESPPAGVATPEWVIETKPTSHLEGPPQKDSNDDSFWITYSEEITREAFLQKRDQSKLR